MQTALAISLSAPGVYTAAESGVPSVVTGPVIAGDEIADGQLLLSDYGTYTGSPTSYALQWYLVDGETLTAITGETAETIDKADAAYVGKSLKIGVTPSNANGAGSEVFSNAIGPIEVYTPNILSPANWSISENVALDIGLEASRAVTWSIVGGADAADFGLASDTLSLPAQSYEAPVDADLNNVYAVTVRATHVSGGAADLAVSVTVLDAVVNAAADTSVDAQSDSTNTTLTISGYTVTQVANRVLEVCSAIQANDALSNVTRGSDTFNLVNSENVLEGAGLRIEMWAALAPAVGTGDIVLTRSGATSARWYARAKLLANVVQELPTGAALGNYQGLTDTSSWGETGHITAPQDDCYLSTFAAATLLSTTAPGIDVPTDYTDSETATAAVGATLVSRLFGRQALTAGSYDLAYVTTNSGSPGDARRTAAITAAWKAVPEEAAVPTYFVKNGGNNADDGLTYETAFATLDAFSALTPAPANFEIVLEDGEYHRTAATWAENTPILNLPAASGVTTETRPRIRSRNGGRAWISGDVVHTGWTDLTDANETNATAVAAATGEKKTVGAGYVRANFPCIDDKMLKPCVWANGTPSSVSAFDDANDGSDAFIFYDTADVQDPDGSPAAYDGTSKVQCKYVVGVWSVKITDPAIAAHYGSRSPVGAGVSLYTDNTQERWADIVNYSQAESWVEFSYSGYSYEGPMKAADEFHWNILACPFDLTRVGEYAWSADGETVYAIWPAGTVKSIARWEEGVQLSGNNWLIEDGEVGICRISARSGSTKSMLEVAGGTGHEIYGVEFKQALNPSRPPIIGVNSQVASGVTVDGFRATECYHHSGIRGNFAQGWTINDVYIREAGRTLIYFGGGATTSANGNRATNVDGCEHNAIHGNFASNYQYSNDNRVQKCGLTNGSNGYTAQIEVYNASRQNWFTNAFGHSMRPITLTVPAVYNEGVQFNRIDNGETDGVYDTLLFPMGAEGKYSWVFGLSSPTKPNGGSVMRRGVFQSLGFSADAGDGTLQLAAIQAHESEFGGTGRTGGQPWDTYGGAVLDSAASPAAANVNTALSWDGCLGDEQWKRITRNDADDGYVSVQFGPDSWGPWTIPAYGGTITLADVALTTDWVREGHQAGKAIGTVRNWSPSSSLSLVTGAGDTDLFEIDRGVVFFKAAAAVTGGADTVYALHIRETNADASNGPTRDTVISVTVYAN